MKQTVIDKDVVVVGAGMAGVATALWCHRLGLSFALLEQAAQIGGQLHSIYNPIPDYPGLLCNGAEVVNHIQQQLNNLGIVPELGVSVTRIRSVQDASQEGSGHDGICGVVECTDRQISTRNLVMATGLRPRRWRVRGAENWMERGIYRTYSGRRTEFAGQRACVVGGGDGALENALMMVEHCPHVTVLCRSDKPRARWGFQEQVRDHPRIDLRVGCDILSVQGQEKLTGLEICEAGEVRFLPVDVVLVKIGMEPQSQELHGLCLCDRDGYLQVDDTQRTSAPWIWAVGDVCTPRDPSLSVAVGQACVAVRAIARSIERNLYSE